MGCSCASGREKPTYIQKQICPDYREYQDKYSGWGIKKTKAWEGNISRLNLWYQRQKFWKEQKPGREMMWLHLREAIESDYTSSFAILQEVGLQILDTNIQLTRDAEGFTYSIPIFVINDPVNWIQQQVEEFEPLDIEVYIRRQRGQDLKIKVKNNKRIGEIKEQTGLENARFFFGGKEMFNERRFMDYPIDQGMVVQAFTSVPQ